MEKRKWTEFEIGYLRRFYKDYTPKRCADELGRTVNSVKKRAGRLGLSKERRSFLSEEIAYIKDNYAEYGPIILAQKMGLNRLSIYELANRRLELKVDPKFWSDLPVRVHTGRKRSEATKKKLSLKAKKKVRELNSNWKGGVTPLRSITTRLLWPAWIHPILCRDNYICQNCEKTSTKLDVHHLRRYRDIRDSVMKENPHLSLDDYDNREKLAKLIILEHTLEDGVTLCRPCHNDIHFANRMNCLGSPNEKDVGNQQPSLSNVIPISR